MTVPDLRTLQAKAAGGDPEAQFELATVLDQGGRRAEATALLEAAAKSGHTDALTLLAVGDLQGVERPRDVEAALARLTDAVLRGGNAARRLLAVLTANGIAGGGPDWRTAIELVIDAGKADDFQALRELALLVEMAVPNSKLAEDLLRRAALRGDGLAGFAAMRRQALRNRTLASERAFALWREAMVRIGHPLANLVAGVASKPEAAPTAPPPDVDWLQVTAVLAAPPGLKHAAPDAVSETPFIRRYASLLTAEECEYLIGLSGRLLVPAEVFDRVASLPKQSQVRTNSVAALRLEHQDLVVYAINLRLAAAAGAAAATGEPTNILMYKPGEEYRPHYDFFPLDAARADPAGQRVRTLLVYLNYDYGAGETQFVGIGRKFKGAVGDALLFHNVDASGAPDRSSLHAGLPVTTGQKWLLSKWYREKVFAG